PPVERKPALLAYKHPGSDSQWKLTSTATLKVRDDDDVDHALALRLNAELQASAAKPGDGDKASIELKLSKLELSATIDDKPIDDTKPGENLTLEGKQVTITLQVGPDGTIQSTGLDLKGVPRAALNRWKALSTRLMQSLEAVTLGLPNAEVTTSKP